MAGLILRNVAKSYEATKVIESIDLEIKDGEFVVFVGPSGCGKSTLLRMIAGLEEIRSGTITIGDQIVNEVAPAKRGVSMVFQTYALYPHMTVYKNMAFGLKQAKTPKDEIDQRVRNAAEILEISSLLDRTPKALSGGQRQRVAIGRAIVREPEVFLFDEPLSNLDAALRVQTRIEIARLHERLGTTMSYVTHDQVEAMTLADKIVVLRHGNIEQIGSPIELYRNPSNMFVAQFIGSPKMNFFDGTIVAKNGSANTADFEGEGIEIKNIKLVSQKKEKSEAVRLGVRPQHLKIDPKGIIHGKIMLIEKLGVETIVELVTKTEKTPFRFATQEMLDFTIGQEVTFSFDPSKVNLF